MVRQLILLLALTGACADRGARPARRYPPTPPWSPPLVGAPDAGAPAPLAAPVTPLPPAAAPSTVGFSVGPVLEFRGGASLKIVPIAQQTAIHALSPDAKSWIIDGPGNTVKLITPAFPQGVSHPVWVPRALFSDDGKRALVFSTSDLAIFDVQSGKLLGKHSGAICNARFAGPNEIVFHGDSKEADARLWRWAVGAPAPTPVGNPRAAETCHALPDGSTWLIESYAERWLVDGRTGGARALTPPAQGGVLSTAGNRLCTADDRGFSCVRYPDERTERVWTKPTSDTLVFDGGGTQALITYAGGPDTVRDSFALVDFVALSVRPLRGVKATSGSLFALTPGAKLLTIGSGSGLHVYDLERGQKRFAAHRPLYGNHVFPHHPRRIVAGTDEPMDLFLVDVP